jgi:nicotinate phosphoribosyltransferase
LDYAKSNPNNAIFLVDTYDTLRSGVPNAIRVAKEYLVPNGFSFQAIRIDSGDLAYLSIEARKMLDAAGFPDVGICLSNGLDEQTIRSLREQGAQVNSYGIGDNIAAAKERVGGVYKLVAVEQDGELLPRIKVSEDAIKTINPGYKKVYRFYDKTTGFALGDVIALAHEQIPTDKFTLVDPINEWKKTDIENYEVRELQVPIFKQGAQVYEIPTIDQRQTYCTQEFATIYPEIKRDLNPHGYYVDLTEELLELKKGLIKRHKEDPPAKEKVLRA